MKNNKLLEIKIALESLTVYRGLLKDDVINKFYLLIKTAISNEDLSSFVSKYGDFYYSLSKITPIQSFRDYVISCILYKDNLFARQCDRQDFDELSIEIKKAVKGDLNCLYKITSVTAEEIKNIFLSDKKDDMLVLETVKKLPELSFNTQVKKKSIEDIFDKYDKSSWEDCIGALAKFHRENGSGVFARYKGFAWEKIGSSYNLRGIINHDSIKFSDLTGYESQRQKVIENTLHFLNGYSANNMLLYGDRGTGKSATVKALLNEYYSMGLRIIELPTTHISSFPEILRLVKGRNQKFIVFIDDLAFEDSEERYTALKAVLEGSLESKPNNVIIYATSNRRNLIKERFSDRAGLVSLNKEDEVHAADTLQEKLSLSDRFGITVTFMAPDKLKYLEIVENIARLRGIQVDKELLHSEALKWEVQYNGRSPRTARQFIDWFEGKIARKE